MSKHEKFLIRFCAKPTPSDITWSELKSYLSHLGFKEKRVLVRGANSYTQKAS